VVEEVSEALPYSGQLAFFDKQHETLITNNPDAMEAINLIRTGLAKIGQLIQTSPQQNGNGTMWKQLVNKAEYEKSIFFKYLDGKTLFMGMLQLYAAIHREMEDSLLPECAQGKEEAAPHSKLRKSNSDSDDGSSISKREATEKCRPLPVYQKTRPEVTKNFFALHPWRVRKSVAKHHFQTTILTKADHPP
jgi:hypothetical protein